MSDDFETRYAQHKELCAKVNELNKAVLFDALAPAGITANAIMAGVTDTPALRLIPGHEKLMEIARMRNPNKRRVHTSDR